ncbi:MAG TPA: PASTA domain-containing protein, partial [Actinomycetota bacterium]
TLSVSVGPVPDVSGQSVDSATAILADSGLSVGDTFEETSESLEAGLVIAIADREDGNSWRPGDAVTLIVSSGPPLFPVPDVIGLTRDQAKAALTEAGFEFEYNAFWDVVIDQATVVDGQDPAAGTERPKGTTVSMTISGSF